MRGIFQLRPSLPKYNCTWDVSVVLHYLSSVKSNNNLSLHDLNMKLAMLLALTTGQRCQSLMYIDIRNIDINDLYIKIRFGDLLKQSRVGYHLQELYIEVYPDNTDLCVVKLLQEYMARTVSIRNSISQLFISSQKPHKAVTSATISKWIKTVLKNAGIDINKFSAHSTRGASTSAVTGHIPIDTVLRTAGWKTDCVFRKFYKRPVTNDSLFSKTILNKAKKSISGDITGTMTE